MNPADSNGRNPQLPASVAAARRCRSWKKQLPDYEHDAAGALVPGATISPQHQYNLAEMGLAWNENVEAKPEFGRFVENLNQEI